MTMNAPRAELAAGSPPSMTDAIARQTPARLPESEPRAVARPPQHYWTAPKLAAAKRRLLERHAVLREDIDRELRKRERSLESLRRERSDVEAAVDALLAEAGFDAIDLDVIELRNVEAALDRLAAGRYGLCTACGEAIDPMRLEFHPQAPRCLHCDERADRRHPLAGPGPRRR